MASIRLVYTWAESAFPPSNLTILIGPWILDIPPANGPLDTATVFDYRSETFFSEPRLAGEISLTQG